MKKFCVVLCTIVVCVSGRVAHAVPLSDMSVITFGGVLTTGTNLATATALDFVGPTFVTSVAGDFMGIGLGSLATFNDLTFATFTGAQNPLWTVAGFRFDLTSVTIDTQNINALVLLGRGFISGNGFDPTPFDLSVSADSIRSVTAFSAVNATSPVPEPSALLLFLTGLALVSYPRMARYART